MLRGILIALLTAAAVLQWLRWPGWAVNTLTLAGLATAALWPRRSAASGWRPLPGLPPWVAAAAAVAAAYPTLGLDYFADDYCLLEMRGGRSFFAALIPDGSDPFVRPVGWAVWWLLGTLFPRSPAGAHAFALVLFVVNVLLVAPALRRMGASRADASWAALLFAVHPAVFDTLCWLSNLYSVLGLGFSLAVFATLPARAPKLRRMLVPAGLAGLAFLSKEDTYLLPIAVVLVGAGFRWRNLGKWILASIPILTVFAVVLTGRLAWFGGIGGYRETATGSSVALNRMWIGLWEAYLTEAPSRYLVPFRDSWMWSSSVRAASLAIPTLLAFGAGSAAVKRAIPRALLLAFLCWAPAASILPTGRQLENARALYGVAVFLAWIASTLLVTAPWNRAIRIAAIAGLVSVSLFAGRINLDAWQRCTDQYRKARESVGAKLRETSNAKDTRTLLLGLPDNVKGAICFRNAGSFFLGRNPEFADRAIEVPPQDGGFFTRILWYDPKTGACQDYIDSWGAALPLTPEGWTADFRGGRRQVDEAHFTSAHVSSVKDGAAWTVWPESFIGNVHLPPLRVSGIRRVRVELDADCLRQDESRSECRLFVTTFQHAFQRRREYSLPAEIDLPATAELLSIDLRIPFGSRLVLRRVTVKPF